MEIKYSDFEKSADNTVKCKDCDKCIRGIGSQFNKCTAMAYWDGEYRHINSAIGMDHTGFKIQKGSYIDLMIQFGGFPNKEGNCQYYQPHLLKKLSDKLFRRK